MPITDEGEAHRLYEAANECFSAMDERIAAKDCDHRENISLIARTGEAIHQIKSRFPEYYDAFLAAQHLTDDQAREWIMLYFVCSGLLIPMHGIEN